MKIIKLTTDILKGLNATVWGAVKEAEKVGKIVKTGISGADVVIGTSHALEDSACGDYVWTTIDVIGNISSTKLTKQLNTITGSITVGCRLVRYYCKNYGTFWGCTIAAGHGLKETIKITRNKTK